MRAIKFCEILMTCVLILLFTCHAAWAVKPGGTSPGHRERVPSHAVLADGPFGDPPVPAIVSDGEGPYIDTSLGGEDDINFTTDKATGTQLLGLTFKTVPWSLRRVRFEFDIAGNPLSPDAEAAFLYGLLLAAKPLAGKVRMGVWYRERFEEEDYFEVGFIVDGITREVLVTAGVDTEKYLFSVGEDKDRGTADDHLAYFLRYDSDLPFAPVEDGWTIESPAPPLDGVTLCVQRRVGVEVPVGNSGKTKLSWEWQDIDLATYTAVPFHLTVIAGSPSPAPRRHKTLSTLWGNIKAK